MQTVRCGAPDLGPYELYQEDSVMSGVQQIVAPESRGALRVLADNNGAERVVCFSVPTDTSAELLVYDLSGNVVKHICLPNLTSGVDYYQPLDVSSWSGLYVVRVVTGTFSLSEKMLVK